MTYLTITTDTSDDFNSTESLDGSARVKISNPDAENGHPTVGGCSWVNSASVEVDPDEDAVTFALSVGDPRGAFVFQVRRTDDGRIFIHTPHPGESMPHLEVTEVHPGTVQVKGDHSDYYAPCASCGELYAKDDMTEDYLGFEEDPDLGAICCDCKSSEEG